MNQENMKLVNEEKVKYDIPEMTIVYLEKDEVITTSTGSSDDSYGGFDQP